MEEINKNGMISVDELGKMEKDGKVLVKVVKVSENGKQIEETDWVEIAKKKWYHSKTMIFNILVAIFTGVGSIIHDRAFEQMVGDYFPYILTIVTIVNVYLRTITTSPIRR